MPPAPESSMLVEVMVIVALELVATKASAELAASLRDVHAEGVERAILFTGLENIAAQRAYEALGFERIGTYRTLLFREGLHVTIP